MRRSRGRRPSCAGSSRRCSRTRPKNPDPSEESEAIDAIAERGECNFVEAIAVPLPLRLIAAMIGVRHEDFDCFHRWSDDMIAADGANDPAVMARAASAFMEYSRYAATEVRTRAAAGKPAGDDADERLRAEVAG